MLAYADVPGRVASARINRWPTADQKGKKMRSAVFLVLIAVFMSACGDGGSDGAPASSGEPVGRSAPPNPGDQTNAAPSISGKPPAEVVYSSKYAFTPQARDPDGDDVFFEITNIPSWASFEPATGELWGKPSLADVGVYDDIVISVSDGIVDKELPPFSITVLENATGTISLNWQPPTQNEDGSPLFDLAGYVIHYGTTSGEYDNEILLDNPGLTSHLIENLAPGTYYVAATSFTSSGVESDYSGEIAATVD
jgi:hypothetical protein